MSKDEILELAKQAGFTIVSGRDTEPWDDSTKLLETFAALIEQSVIKRLSAGAGEPFDDWPEFNQHAMGCGLEDRDIVNRYEAMQYGWEDCQERMLEQGPFYTAEQVAAAVAAERLACAEVCESLFDADDKSCDEAQQCAAAIRGRTV